MSDPPISGNDIFSHATVGAADLEASSRFYDAALGALGIKNLGPRRVHDSYESQENHFLLYILNRFNVHIISDSART